MKKAILIYALSLLLITGVFSWSIYLKRDRVEQEIQEDNDKILCPSGQCYITYVLYNKEIIQVWWDDLPTITDSLVDRRRTEAERLLKVIKKQSW